MHPWWKIESFNVCFVLECVLKQQDNYDNLMIEKMQWKKLTKEKAFLWVAIMLYFFLQNLVFMNETIQDVVCYERVCEDTERTCLRLDVMYVYSQTYTGKK